MIFLRITYTIIWLIIAYHLNIFLHELGHAIFAVLTGKKVYGMQMGKKVYIKNAFSGKWEKKTEKPRGYVGRCYMMPKEKRITDKYPFVLLSAGGIFVNGVTALICFGMIFLTMDKKIMLIPFSTLFISAFILFLANAIPIYDEKTGTATDGFCIYYMIKNPEERKCSWCSAYIRGMEYTGTRLKDISEEYYIAYKGCNTRIASVSELKKYHAEYLIDCGQYESAVRLLDELISENVVKGDEYEEMKCDRIWLALQRNEVELSKKMYDIKLRKFIQNHKSSDLRVLRLIYAYKKMQNVNRSLDVILKCFYNLCKEYPSNGRVLMEQDWISRHM